MPANIGGPLSFSSPDTPGMPAPSDKTAWDFLPEGWTRAESGLAVAPPGFRAVTQLEQARLGVVTKEMERVAERERHLSAEQVRVEVAAGRMIVPANTVHLGYRLEPMCDRSREPHQDQRQHGRLARGLEHRRGSGEAAVGGALGRRHGDGSVDGRRPRRVPGRHHPRLDGADRHRADLLDDHRSQDRGPDREGDPRESLAPGPARRRLLHHSRRRACASTCRSCATD